MSIVWFNGSFANGAIALDPRDRGFLLGDGVFETLLVRDHKAILLTAHLNRLAKAATEVGIIFDATLVRGGIAAVMAKSRTAAEVLRITLSRGATARGLASPCVSPSLLITLDDFTAGSQPETYRLKVSAVRRNEHAPSSRMKTTSYIDGIVAAHEVAAEADDALMLNTAGNVASTTVANIFMLRGEELITPGLDQGILPGTIRRVLLDAAASISLFPVERVVSLEELYHADGVFICNSLRLVKPVVKVNDVTLATNSMADLMKGLNDEIFC